LIQLVRREKEITGSQPAEGIAYCMQSTVERLIYVCRNTNARKHTHARAEASYLRALRLITRIKRSLLERRSFV